MKNYTFILLSACLVAINARAQAPLQRNAQGLQYQIFPLGKGEKIKQGDVITFHAVQRTDKDSILFSTYLQGQPVKAQVHPSTNPGDLMEVFPLLAVNDSAMVKVPVDSVFKGHEAELPPFLKKGSILTFTLKIVKVQSMNEAIAERNADIEKLRLAEKTAADVYVKAHQLNPLATSSGLRYVITRAGVKPKPLSGDTVIVNYTGRLVNGNVFDSNIAADVKAAGMEQPGRIYEPLKFPVGKAKVIQGWDEGLLLLNEGSKATFIVPSALAYGQTGSGEAIPPYSTLVFDVELVKVVRVRHSAARPVARPKPLLKKRTAVKKKN